MASGPLTDPVTAITLLQTALSDRGIASTRIKVVDAGTAMLMAGEQIVLCRDGCFWWATGRFRKAAAHDVADPCGTARRLARPHASPQSAGIPTLVR